jgi:hypothetical protein
MREKIPKELRSQVLEKTSGLCGYCGEELSEKGWHVDHIIPVASSGPDDIMNLMPACSKCNNYKSSLTLEQFRHEIQMQVERARKYSVNFRMAERFKQITVNETKIMFHFEKIGQTFDEELVKAQMRRK